MDDGSVIALNIKIEADVSFRIAQVTLTRLMCCFGCGYDGGVVVWWCRGVLCLTSPGLPPRYRGTATPPRQSLCQR